MKKILFFFLVFCTLCTSGSEITRQTLNDLLGIPLFTSEKTWSKNALQQRLKLRLTGNNRRFSTRFNRNIAGAKPVELEIHTADDNDTVTIISVTYANQGDSQENYKTLIRDTGRTISKRMNNCGKKIKGGFSDGVFKIKGDLWQTKYARFVLEMDKGDFVLFHILPPEGLKKTTDPGKKDFSKNVKRNNFGDVWIPNVPMVDQGPKGYCVPATMTRIFLYYGIHMDMHHMAKMGNTGRGEKEGTFLHIIFKEINQLRRDARLKMKEISSISIKNIARCIDKGHPVFWIIYKDPGKAYAFSNANRSKAATPEIWNRKLKKFSISSFPKSDHVLLIIGYNEKTEEIAVSNSWGENHIKPTWIQLKIAQRVTSGNLVVFSP